MFNCFLLYVKLCWRKPPQIWTGNTESLYASLQRNERHVPFHNPIQRSTIASARLLALAKNCDSCLSLLFFFFFFRNVGLWAREGFIWYYWGTYYYFQNFCCWYSAKFKCSHEKNPKPTLRWSVSQYLPSDWLPQPVCGSLLRALLFLKA